MKTRWPGISAEGFPPLTAGAVGPSLGSGTQASDLRVLCRVGGAAVGADLILSDLWVWDCRGTLAVSKRGAGESESGPSVATPKSVDHASSSEANMTTCPAP